MCAKVAWIWPPASYPKSFWLEEKKDSMQYTIEEIAKEHDVLLLAPVGKESQRVGWRHFYVSSEEALLALRVFDPDVINLNLFRHALNRKIAVEFPKSLITVYDHGGDLFCPYSEHVDVFFTAQDYRRRLVAQRNRVPIEKVILNPHGADPKRFYPDDSVEKIYTGIMVGDFRERKRQHLIISNWREAEGRLLLHGRTHGPLADSGYLKRCRRLIEKLNLSESITISGFGPYEELPQIINSAEIGIHVGGWGESGNRSITEMMMCGLPMIVPNDCQSHMEWIKDGGLEVNPNAIGAAVRQLKNDPTKYQEMREAALRRAKPHTYDRMLATFRRVIEGGDT